MSIELTKKEIEELLGLIHSQLIDGCYWESDGLLADLENKLKKELSKEA